MQPQEKQKHLKPSRANWETIWYGCNYEIRGNPKTDIEAISTGSLSLDVALGIGGLPMGRIVEIFGPESSGKTTLTLSVIALSTKSR